MSFRNDDQVFHHISEQELAEIISYNLRKDYGHCGSSVKEIAQITKLNPRIIRNWYEGRNTPNLTNFLVLMQCSPRLSKTMTELLKSDNFKTIFNVLKQNEENIKTKIYGDRIVTISISLRKNILLKLNQRQLWFYGVLQKGLSMKADDIVNIWDVNIRTAKRDISELIDLNLIEFSGANKNGRYLVKN